FQGIISSLNELLPPASERRQNYSEKEVKKDGKNEKEIHEVPSEHINATMVLFYDALKSIVNRHWKDLSDTERDSFSFAKEWTQTVIESEEVISTLNAQRRNVAVKMQEVSASNADRMAHTAKLRSDLNAIKRQQTRS
uniref:MIP-T3 domain-containing protein n=1 Tax=Steinernema glaseri TaxID=37863 RepID=A0A1I8AHX2_9BILA